MRAALPPPQECQRVAGDARLRLDRSRRFQPRSYTAVPFCGEGEIDSTFNVRSNGSGKKSG
jgi:hypothetical protein